MLQFMSRLAGTIIGGVLFVLLVASFALWGLGDILTSEDGRTEVATVGESVITAEEVEFALQRNQGAAGLTPELVGIFAEVTLQNLINETLLREEATLIGAEVSPQDATRFVQLLFRDAQGGFDRAAFNDFLIGNQTSEAQYLTRVGDLLTSSLLVGALAPPVALGGDAAIALARYNTTEVTGFVQRLYPDRTLTIPPADSTSLQAYLDANPAQFRIGEQRSGRYFVLKPADFGAAISDAEVRSYYDADPTRYSTAERRQWEQTFAGVTSTFGPYSFDEVLDPQVAEAVFDGNLQLDAPFEIEGSLGTYSIVVKAIAPAQNPTFEEVATQARAELEAANTQSQFIGALEAIEDAIVTNGSIDEAQGIAASLSAAITINRFDNVSQGTRADSGGLTSDIVDVVFGLDADLIAESYLIGEDLYVFALDAVVPEAVPPLASIESLVRLAWQEEQYARALFARYSAGTTRTQPDAVLGEVFALNNTPISEIRPNGGVNVPTAVESALRALAPGGSTAAITQSGEVWLLYVDSKNQGDTVDPQSVVTAGNNIRNATEVGWSTILDQQVRTRHSVEIDEAAMQRYFSGTSNADN